MMRLLLTSMLLVFASPAVAAEVHAVIIAGSTSQSETEAKLAAWQKLAASFFIDLPAGYPKIEKSEKVPGLKPGFVVAIAGYCAQPPTLALAELKRIEPGTYTRKVQVDGLACPAVTPAAYARQKWTQARSSDAGSEMTLQLFESQSPRAAVALLVGADGAAIDRYSPETPSEEDGNSGLHLTGCDVTVSSDTRLVQTCEWVNSGTGCYPTETTPIDLKVVKGKLVARKGKAKRKESCAE